MMETPCYQFGDYLLDGQQRTLRREQEPVALTPKAFDLLLALVASGGCVLTKEELMQKVWPDSFVEESNLTQTVFMLRKALGETPDQRYIVTIPGKGYRFAPGVRKVAKEGAPGAETGPERGGDMQRHRPAGVARWWRVVAGMALVLALAVAVYVGWRQRGGRFPAEGRLMIAVLPFTNLTGDAGEDYFSDGMTEEMITRLGQENPEQVGVIGRTSAMLYRNTPKPLDQIGRELGVEYLLEGSVRREAGKVRITAQLIRAKDQTHMWARHYDREAKEVLVLQSEIAREISDEVQGTLGNPKPASAERAASLPPEAYEAYNLCLKGQYFWNKRTVEGFEQAIEYFEQAAAKDPAYARAYAGLADAYALIGGYSGTPQAHAMPKARAAAIRALELDSSLPEAHAALALIVQNYDHDWPTAEREFRRAIELNPSYATAHHWYAEHLTWRGRFDEALQEYDRARQLDPLSLIIATDRASTLYYARQYDRAIEQYRSVEEMDPRFSRAGMIVFAFSGKGMFAEARAEVEKRRALWGDSPWGLAMLAYVEGRAGHKAKAQSALARLKDFDRAQPVDPAAFVWAYLGVGSKDETFAWLKRAESEHSNLMATLKVEPAFDALRQDERFKELVRRVGLE